MELLIQYSCQKYKYLIPTTNCIHNSKYCLQYIINVSVVLFIFGLNSEEDHFIFKQTPRKEKRKKRGEAETLTPSFQMFYNFQKRTFLFSRYRNSLYISNYLKSILEESTLTCIDDYLGLPVSISTIWSSSQACPVSR